MSNIFEELGLDATAYTEAEEQTVGKGFEVLPSGVYTGSVKELATFTTDSGAGMMKAVIEIEADGDNREITVYQNIKKKDGSANTIGTATFKHIVEATNTEMAMLSTKKEQIKAYGKDVQATVVQGLIGKKIKAFVRAVHEEGATYENYNEIEAYARVDGTNSKGENIEEAFIEKITKTPVLERKAKQSSNSSKEPTTEAGQQAKDLL